jgi:hypothetical protein
LTCNVLQPKLVVVQRSERLMTASPRKRKEIGFEVEKRRMEPKAGQAQRMEKRMPTKKMKDKERSFVRRVSLKV